jgi:hypothetical protein
LGVRPEEELVTTSRPLVERQVELSGLIAPIFWIRLSRLWLEKIMTIPGIQLAELSETRACQDILAKARHEGLDQRGQRAAGAIGAVVVAAPLLRGVGRAGSYPPRHEHGGAGGPGGGTDRFSSPADLTNWHVEHRG